MKRDLNRYFYDYINQPFEDVQVIFRKKKVIERLKFYKPKKILEVGAGTQSQLLLDYDFEELKIIEPNRNFYNLNNDLINDHQIINASIDNCYFESFNSDSSYDLILLSSLLHEIEDLGVFFKKLTDICSSNTVIHINVPNSNSFHRLLAKSMGIIKNTSEKSSRNIKLQTSRIFDIISLEKLISEYNFKILHTESFFIKPFTHSQMQKMLDDNIISMDVLDGLYNLNLDFLNSKECFGSELIIEFSL